MSHPKASVLGTIGIIALKSSVSLCNVIVCLVTFYCPMKCYQFFFNHYTKSGQPFLQCIV